MQLTEKDIARFWSKVDRRGPNDCWLWVGGKKRRGYGQMGIGRRLQSAHRIAFAISHPDWDDSLHVLHSCDNPPCCNPAHLHLGTNADNVAEKVARGRLSSGTKHSDIMQRVAARGDRSSRRLHPGAYPIGEAMHTARLTESAVREIRARYVPWKVTLNMLASEYGVSDVVIGLVVRRKTWKHVV